MPIAILDPFSGVSGDMMLGALVAVGLDPDWLRALPERLGLDGVTVHIQEVVRGEVVCQKVDFDIPPQPHGRHLREIRRLIQAADVPPAVAARADRVFTAIATAEAEIHGMQPEQVHLHEVGAVDAILDVVGAVWGLELLGVTSVHCGTLMLGDGFVTAAHGVLPVPAPATLKLLEGLSVRPGPDGAGELVTPTGAALVRELSAGLPPAEYRPIRSGFGAGSRDPAGRANALRLILADGAAMREPADTRESLLLLAADMDDATGEELAVLAERLREAGALDVVSVPVLMKKGRPGVRVEALCQPSDRPVLERAYFRHGSTIGVRSTTVSRLALARETRSVDVLGHAVRLKRVQLEDGSSREKAELDDLDHVAAVTGRTVSEVRALTASAAERP